MAAPSVERRFIDNPTSEEIPYTADVVIIGGGMAGPAASWALNREMPGIKTVLIEEAHQLAAGASQASIENFRSCWPTPALAVQMSRSQEIYLHADEYLGEGAAKALNVRQRGYLYCGFTPSQAENLKNDVQELHDMGLGHIEYLDEKDVHDRYPWLGPHVVAAKVDPKAGWMDSNALAYQYAKNGKDAKFLLGMPHSQIIVEGGKVVGVMTDKGVIQTEKVIIAAGAGSRIIGRTAGIEIPIVLRPRQSFVTSFRDSNIPPDAPFVIGNSPWVYMRPESGGGIFGWEYQWKNTVDPKNGKADHNSGEDYLINPVPLDRVKDERFPSVALDVMHHQFGEIFNRDRYLKGVKMQAGYYVYRSPENTYMTAADGTTKSYESERAILDVWPDIKGLFLSVAHVGHGVMSSAASGEIIAAHVLGNDLSNPLFYDFKLNVHWVPKDGGGL